MCFNFSNKLIRIYKILDMKVVSFKQFRQHRNIIKFFKYVFKSVLIFFLKHKQLEDGFRNIQIYSMKQYEAN